MESWIGPAIVAAVISSLVSVIGWWINHRHEERMQAARRHERVQDVQTALRAEIRSHRQRLMLFEEATKFDEVREAGGRDFTPFVPREVASFVFDATLKDVPVLPTEVIDPIVIYYRQVHALAQFADDLRSDRFFALDWQRKVAMHADYIAMGIYAGALADAAISAIDIALARGALNSSDAVPSGQRSVSGGAGQESDGGSKP